LRLDGLFNDLLDVACYDKQHIGFSVWYNYFGALSLHVSISARLLPDLRLTLMLPLRVQGLGTSGWLVLT